MSNISPSNPVFFHSELHRSANKLSVYYKMSALGC